MKVSIQKTKVRGHWKWAVSWKPKNAPRIRHYHDKKTEAESERDDLELQQSQAGEIWLSMTAHQRQGLIAAMNDAEKGGFTVQYAVEFYRANKGKISAVTLGAAYKKFMDEKETQKLSDSTMAALKSNVGRFVSGREEIFVHAVKRDDVMDFLKPYTDATFNSYLTSLNTFFLWCVKVEIIFKSPAEKISKIPKRRFENADVAPKTFTFDELKSLLKSTLETDPGLIRYVAVCNFAGLRPEKEAAKLSPADIGEEIHVRGKTAKDRQARFVKILPVLAAWLALPCAEPLQGPFSGDYPIKNLRRRFDAVRAKAGLIKLEFKTRPKKKGKGVVVIGQKITETNWVQDIMRHTFASIYLALFGPEATIEALGHGDYEMLFQHYRKLMTKATAEKFLSLTPELIQK